MLKLTTNVFSICVHFDHFTSDFGNVKCVATTFKYSLSLNFIMNSITNKAGNIFIGKGESETRL